MRHRRPLAEWTAAELPRTSNTANVWGRYPMSRSNTTANVWRGIRCHAAISRLTCGEVSDVTQQYHGYRVARYPMSRSNNTANV